MKRYSKFLFLELKDGLEADLIFDKIDILGNTMFFRYNNITMLTIYPENKKLKVNRKIVRDNDVILQFIIK